MTEPHLDLAEVHRVAGLARLDLTPAQEAQAAADFERILTHVDALQAVDTQGVRPTQHAVAIALALRADTVAPSLAVQDALKNAPERLGDGFGVPKIIE